MAEISLSLKSVSKEYYGNKVLNNISMDVRKGEIHALVGENGAGKSTLMNILFGMPVIHSTGGFEGSIEINGVAAEIKSPFEAMKNGIGMIHQEFMLIPGFTITENIKINREDTKHGIASRIGLKRLETINYKQMNADSRRALDKLNMGIEEYTMVAGLPIGHMQFVEIARELDKHSLKILVFDEPTAVLTEIETENLLDAIKNLAAMGIGIIFISHRLDEVIKISDRVTVLRDGEHVVTKDVKDTNIIEIAQYMVGRKVSIARTETGERKKSENIVLSIKDLHVVMPGEMVRGVDLEVRKGEIVGIGGLAGQGKIGIANGLMGIYPAKGKVVLNGKPLVLNNPKESIRSGIGFVSEDRKGIGLLLNESIELNIAFTEMQISEGFLHKLGPFSTKASKKIRDHARKMIKDLDIRCTSPAQHTGRLSGGNQQKVCLARALTQNPALLLVSEPTRGIDIGAKKLVLDLLLKMNEEMRMTIIVTSSELAELRSICDRIVIICDGKIEGELSPTASDVDFGLMMSGSKIIAADARGHDADVDYISTAQQSAEGGNNQ